MLWAFDVAIGITYFIDLVTKSNLPLSYVEIRFLIGLLLINVACIGYKISKEKKYDV